jgi:hypothetical protein
MASCLEYAEDAAEKFRKEGWTVLHDESECEWYFTWPVRAAGFPHPFELSSFELVIGDCDIDPSDVESKSDVPAEG